jgi:hypothetical protein
MKEEVMTKRNPLMEIVALVRSVDIIMMNVFARAIDFMSF